MRQNLRTNHALCDAYDADMTMVSSEIIASGCLALLQTPLLGRFLEALGHADSPVTLGDLRRDPSDRDRTLPCAPLLLSRGTTTLILPDLAVPLQLLRNVNVCDYALRGIDVPGGWIWQRVTRRPSGGTGQIDGVRR